MTKAESPTIRQLIYRSKATSSPLDHDKDLAEILAQSQTNNGIEGVSGLLLARDGQYLQILEGSADGVGHIFGRIAVDQRHTDVEVVMDVAVERRAFGGWGMGHPGKDDADQVAFRVERFLAEAPVELRKVFEELGAA
jgi:hypothetical protein